MKKIHTFPWWEVPYIPVFRALERVGDDHSLESAKFLISMGVRDPLIISAALLHHAPRMEGFPEEVWEARDSFLVKLACAWARGRRERLKALRGLKPPPSYIGLYLSALIKAKSELLSEEGDGSKV